MVENAYFSVNTGTVMQHEALLQPFVDKMNESDEPTQLQWLSKSSQGTFQDTNKSKNVISAVTIEMNLD